MGEFKLFSRRWWRRRELGCRSTLKERKLLILQVAKCAKNAVIARPSYVKLTWVSTLYASGKVGSILHGLDRLK